MEQKPEYLSEKQRLVCKAKMAKGYEFIGMGKVRMQGEKLFPHFEHTWKASWDGKERTSHVAIDENGYDIYMSTL